MQKDIKIYAYASSGIVPVRKSASETAEMVTQLLLGETVRILKSEDRWYYIKSDFDHYEGWVSINQISILSESDYIAWSNHPERKRSPFFTYRIHRGQKTYLMVPAGAPVVYTGFEVELPDGPWSVASEPVRLKEHAIIDTALKLLGVPYLWGGRTDSGIDCSGFVQLVYGLHQYFLPRDASQQYDFAPIKAKTIDKAEYSDIIYFSSTGKSITHTGFYIGEGHLLHASGNVQINCIDPRKRNVSRFVFNERLADTVAGVQASASIKAAATEIILEGT